MSFKANLPSNIIQRLAKELRQLITKPLDGIQYLPQEDEQLTNIHVEIQGPVGTPYEGGYFHVQLQLSDEFPSIPPRGIFRTRIFHPNIATNGDICVNTLKKDWSSDLHISHVLQVIRCLLIVPFPESALNEEAGKLFMESYNEYARRARILTQIHAKQSQCKQEKHGKRSASPAANTYDKTKARAQSDYLNTENVLDTEMVLSTQNNEYKENSKQIMAGTTIDMENKATISAGDLLSRKRPYNSTTQDSAMLRKKKAMRRL